MTVDRTQAGALARDAEADQACRRSLFRIPRAESGPHQEVAYLAGNSLGLQPKATREELLEDLDAWADLAVHGHVESSRPWLPYHAGLTEPTARLVGALPDEVVVMNSLTVNLHLLMASFYRPTASRYRIVVEDYCFSSDSYAVRSHARFRGYDPEDAIVRLRPRPGEDTLRTADVVDRLQADGDSIALILLGGVNYLTGELMDMAGITAATRAAGAVAGWDLAHAAGNVPLALHDWDVDFASWCSYKYLNSGPGAVAGVFVHERHVADPDIPRLSGWWSNDPANRFEMLPELTPVASADAWQMSNPPILALAPVVTSLGIFDSAGMAALRERSVRLTGWLESLLDEQVLPLGFELLTPRDPADRGTQLSVHTGGLDAREVSHRLRHEHGVIADARGASVIRLAPVPLYCTYLDCARAAEALATIGASR